MIYNILSILLSRKLVQHRKSIANSHRKSGSESLPKQPIRPAPTAPPGNAGTNQQNEPSQQAATNYKHGQQSELEKASMHTILKYISVICLLVYQRLYLFYTFSDKISFLPDSYFLLYKFFSKMFN